MGYWFWKRVKIVLGVYFNISKFGISFNFGVFGVNVMFGKRLRLNVGLFGIGFFY